MRFRFLTIPMARRAFMLILTLAIGSICAFGTTYYVATTGSDSNPGSATLPFLTIQHAANLVNPGDTVIVNDGVYSGTCNNSNPNYCDFLTITRGGTSTAWVTFEAANTWGAILDGKNFSIGQGIDLRGVQYVRIEGFEIRNFATDALASYVGGSNLDFVKNHIHNIGNYCTDDGQGRDGIFLSDSNITIEQNLMHDIGRLSPGQNGCNPSTKYYENHDHGIYLDASGGTETGIVVKNNIFYNVSHGWAVQFYSGSGGTVSNSSIVNNTFAFPNPYRVGHILVDENLTNVNIENNIFYEPTTAGIAIYGVGYTFSSVNIKNNLTYPGSVDAVEDGGSTYGIMFAANLENTDPKLMSASGLNFNLTAGSPAIDAGLSIASVTNDYAGNPRPQGAAYDIGAYEFQTASAPTITSLMANPTAINAGGSSTLSWLVTGATSLSIDQGVGTVTGQSSVEVNPLQTTIYTLTATNSHGTATSHVTVSINSGCTQ